MRIALVTRHLKDQTSMAAFGGLSRELSRQGHEVTLLTSSLPSPRERSELGGPCRRLSAELETFDRIHLRVGGMHENPLVRELAAFARRRPRARVSLQFDDFGNPNLGPECPKTAKTLAGLLGGGAKACAISRAVRARVLRRWPRAGVRVIPTGVDPGPEPRGDGRYILSLGRLSPYKGLDLLLFAFAGIAAEFHAELRIAGPGTDDRYLKELARSLGIAGRVRLLGAVPHREIPRLLAGAKLFVMASRWEAFGLSALEAMAAGKPVIVPKLGGFADYVKDGETGHLVKPGDPESLAEAMRDLLSSPRRASSMGQAARRTAERYRWSAIARRYLALWR